MDIKMIEARLSRAENVRDLFAVVEDLVEHQIEFERELEDKLASLDSDNIVEIDFGRTRYKNLKIGGTTDEGV